MSGILTKSVSMVIRLIKHLLKNVVPKSPLKVTENNEKINYAVDNCVKAAGVAFQLVIIFKAKHLAVNWCINYPKNTEYTTSP